MSASDDLLAALANLINAMLDYEKTWNEYASIDPRADNEFRIAKGIAHQVLLDHTRKYVELAHKAGRVDLIIRRSDNNVTIQPATETNEAKN